MRTFFLLLCALSLYGSSFSEIKEMIRNNPELRSLKNLAEAKNEEAVLSGKLENPSLKIFANDINLQQPFSRDIEAMQSQGIILTQKIPTAGKLDYLKNADISLKEAKEYEYELLLKRLFLEADIVTFKISAIEKKLLLLKEYNRLIDYTSRLLEQYSQSLGTPHTAIIKAEILKSNIDTQTIKLQNLKKRYLEKLSSITASKISSIEREMKIYEIKNRDFYEKKLLSHPGLKIIKKLMQAKKERINYYKAQKTPDIGVSAGYFNRENRDDYISVSLSFKLPIYGREDLKTSISMKELSSLEKIYENEKLKLRFGLRSAFIKAEDSLKRYKIVDEIIQRDLSHQMDIVIQNLAANTAMAENAVEVIEKTLKFELEKVDILYEFNSAMSEISYYSGDEL
ncbi:TolC family protein [Nitrosophilus alvini]|uniref:TolC family protein n=1 Tax=Nitrosophilus alvini TaxID=2714855 RepID=UPI00190BBB6C|nr:TolC family protein [Nitrosophilus alvini]